MSNIFFTSDHHFGHTNIIKSCDRPFKDSDDMDETMIIHWNELVKPHDRVYHLGDISFHNVKKTNEILNRLNGDIYYIRGNHDKAVKQWAWRFVWVKDLYNGQFDGMYITLCHYAMRVWNRSFHGTHHLYGHSHGSLESTDKSFDVGVDCWAFYPLPIEIVKKIFERTDNENQNEIKSQIQIENNESFNAIY